MLVTFSLPVLVRFLSNTWFICRYTCFLLQKFPSIYCCILSQERFTNEARRGGVVLRLHRCKRIVCGNARKFIMVCDIMWQPKAHCWVAFQIPVSQGTWESSSTYYAWVWPRDRNFNPTINTALHVRNGFIHFCCHESTQIYKHDQGYPPYHVINRNRKWRIFFCW